MLRHLSLMSLLLACTKATPTPDAPVPSARRVEFQPDTTLRGWEASDSAALALGIGLLRRTPLPEGSQEIRIWTGIAIGTPHDLLRVVRRGKRVEGSMALHWRVEEPDTGGRSKSAPIDAVVKHGNAGRCGAFRRFGNVEACSLRLTQTPEWRAIWDSLEVLGVWTIPDQSELPKDDTMVLDGWSMTVEVRDGARYRSFAYDNPDAHQHPQQAAAAAIGRIDWGLATLIPRPSNEHLYRGRLEVGPGVSEFTVCGSDTTWEVQGSLGARIDSATTPRTGQDATFLQTYYAELRGMLAYPGLAQEWGRPYSQILEVDSVVVAKDWARRHC